MIELLANIFWNINFFICGLHLGGAPDADDVSAIPPSVKQRKNWNCERITIQQPQNWLTVHVYHTVSWDHTDIPIKLYQLYQTTNTARRQFFVLGHSNPLSAMEIVETCVIPTVAPCHATLQSRKLDSQWLGLLSNGIWKKNSQPL